MVCGSVGFHSGKSFLYRWSYSVGKAFDSSDLEEAIEDLEDRVDDLEDD